MALFYKNQGEIEALSVKTEVASYRLSEQRAILYGGRGSKYDELVYLRGQNGDAQVVNQKDSDAWSKFGNANGSDGSSRSMQIQRLFFENGLYP